MCTMELASECVSYRTLTDHDTTDFGDNQAVYHVSLFRTTLSASRRSYESTLEQRIPYRR